MIRIRKAAYWAIPPLLSLLIYWPGLTAWFQKDDFVWLNLHIMLENGEGLGRVLFAPFSQGTIRTISERVYFLSFYYLFGMNAFPFRLLGFLTHVANLALLCIVCRKLTGMRSAGFWAAILYTVNSALAVALSWTAIYYEILCTFSFLLNLWLLMRYAETDKRRYLIWHWLAFLLGFGVLELNVVYPAMATLYALCRARHLIWRIIPMFIPSAIYTAIHFAVTTPAASGPYKMFWDASMLKTLWTYWVWSLGPSRLSIIGIPPTFLRSAATVFLIAGLCGFLGWKLWRREWVAALFPGWFLIVLAPLLPLRDHVSEYYLTVPLIGLAMWGGWAIACGWRSSVWLRVAAMSLVAIYLAVSIPLTHIVSKSFHDRSLRIEALVTGVAAQYKGQEGKAIVLKNAEAEMIRSAIYHNPFRIYGFGDAYLVPEDEERFRSDPMHDVMKDRFIAAKELSRMIEENRAVVYDVRDEHVVDITGRYRAPRESKGDEDAWGGPPLVRSRPPGRPPERVPWPASAAGPGGPPHNERIIE